MWHTNVRKSRERVRERGLPQWISSEKIVIPQLPYKVPSHVVRTKRDEQGQPPNSNKPHFVVAYED